ncbi:MAG: hypothetical protein ACHQVS_01350 [Candidatus Babeliales bacterium]
MKYSFIVMGCLGVLPVVAADLQRLSDIYKNESPEAHYRLYVRDQGIRDQNGSDAGSDGQLLDRTSLEPDLPPESMGLPSRTNSLELELLPEDMRPPSRTTSVNGIEIGEVAVPRTINRVASWLCPYRCRHVAICAAVTLVGGVVSYILINKFAP